MTRCRIGWLAGAVPLVAVVAAACGWRPSGSFTPNPPPSGPRSFEAVLAAVEKAPPRDQAPVAVGVTGGAEVEGEGSIFAWDLRAGRALWQQRTKAVSTPHVLGRYVVAEEGTAGRVVVRDLATGAELLVHENEDLHLIGGDGEGDSTIIGLSTGLDERAYSTLVLVRGGEVAWRLSVGFAIGTPALRGGLVFVPWATHTLSVLDAANGRQVLLSRIDDVLGHAFVDRGNVYLGQHALFRLTKSFIGGAKAKAARYQPAARSLPGQPPLLRDPFEVPQGPTSAVNRVQLVWRPAGEGETVALQDETLYFQFYRLVFAFEPGRDELRWVYQNDQDLVGAAAQPGGVLLADSGGTFVLVDARTGQPAWQVETGLAPLFVRFRADLFAQTAENAAAPAPLAEQLVKTAQIPDTQLAGGRALAVRYLARLESPAVTEHLITLCDAEGASTPAPVRDQACNGLAKRTEGPDHVVNALKRQARFLKGEGAPPVGPLAQAAQQMKLQRAVPLLLRHLEDPHTPDADLPALLAAIKALGSPGVMDPVERFLVLYHADVSSAELDEALVTAVEALAEHRGKAASPTLKRIADDPMSVAAVKARAAGALAQLAAPPAPAKTAPAEPPPAAAKSAPEKAEAPAAPPAKTGKAAASKTPAKAGGGGKAAGEAGRPAKAKAPAKAVPQAIDSERVAPPPPPPPPEGDRR